MELERTLGFPHAVQIVLVVLDVVLNENLGCILHGPVGGLVGSWQEEVVVEHLLNVALGRYRPDGLRLLRDASQEVVYGSSVAQFWGEPGLKADKGA